MADTSQANELFCRKCGYLAIDRGNGCTADYWQHMGTAHDIGPGVEPKGEPMDATEST